MNIENSELILIDFRHILACIHFNENVLRETKRSKSGTPYTRVAYPKFKLGEEMVRNVAVPATYSKCSAYASAFFHDSIPALSPVLIFNIFYF